MIKSSIISSVLQSKNVSLDSAIVLYEGVVDEPSIDYIVQQVDHAINTGLIPQYISKKVFNITIEVSQNLFHYLSKNELPAVYASALFGLVNNESGVHITSGNFVKKEEVNSLESRIETLNNLTKEEVKSLYRGVLDVGNVSDQGGAGLGFIDVARKSGNKIDYEFVEVDDHFSFLLLKININE